MGVRMTGSQFREFMNSSWGPDAYWEESLVHVNGKEVPEDDDPLDHVRTGAELVEIKQGVIIHDQNILQFQEGNQTDAVVFAPHWLKARTTGHVLVELPQEKVAAFRDHAAKFPGAKVLKT